MARTTCIQCGSIYEEGEKFCPKDDTPLTRLVECRRCQRPMPPDAPFCAHCRGAKAGFAAPSRGGAMAVLGGAILAAVVAFAGLHFGPKVVRAAKDGIASSAPGAAGTARDPDFASREFQAWRPALLGDAFRGTAASTSGGPVLRSVPARRVALRPRASASAARRPLARHAALQVPAAGAEAWGRDSGIESRLAALGMPNVRVMRSNRSLQLTGTVANDGELRTLYRAIYDLGYGEVSYGVEVR